MEPIDTKIRLLDAAEARFLHQGIEATSVRTIVQDAGANLASIHYHFGSKEALVEEVFARRIKPINAERLASLDEIERRPEPALDDILRAFLAPVMFARQPDAHGGQPLMRLFGRIYSEKPEIQVLVHKQFSEVAERFNGAFQRVLPDLDPETIFWRFKFMIGAMAMAMMPHAGMPESFNQIDANPESEMVLSRLIDFLKAGFVSKPTTPSPKSLDTR